MTWSSSLSVPGFVAAHRVGLDPLGLVEGVVVAWQWAGSYQCGATYRTGGSVDEAGPPRVALTAEGMRARMIGTALDRLVREARGLGADGVVEVQLRLREAANEDMYEITALGTAVRFAAGRPPLVTPFLAERSAQEVAALLAAGWAPAGIAVGVAAVVQHYDLGSQLAVGRGAPTAEVVADTGLIQATLQRARDAARRSAEKLGADGSLLRSPRLRVFAADPVEFHDDRVAEALVLGTAIVRTATTPAPRALPVLRLR